jgi:Ala-tRNA(Pro) deacylase
MNTDTPSAPFANEQNLFDRLDAIGIVHTTYRHPALHSVEDAQAARKALPEMQGGHCKNLFLKDKKGVFWLFVTLEEKRVDMSALQKILGAARLSFGKPEYMKEYLGVVPGSVTPFAAINEASQNVRFILDSEMLTHETLNYHPLHNAATTSIKSQDLLLFLENCGHKPEIITI